jgi:hypothetical protein
VPSLRQNEAPRRWTQFKNYSCSLLSQVLKQKSTPGQKNEGGGGACAAKAVALLGSGGDEALYMNELRGACEEIWGRYKVISNFFDYYTAISGGSGVVMELNSFGVFLDDCHIPEESPAPGSKRTGPLCNLSALDNHIRSGESRGRWLSCRRECFEWR